MKIGLWAVHKIRHSPGEGPKKLWQFVTEGRRKIMWRHIIMKP